mmetsp:Transcript_96809/g.252446  ORF Transcript_96809/g.252446 Transcript_96809/m.252446 type:complete len:114 (-) Transcript_96809:376-717(-)
MASSWCAAQATRQTRRTLHLHSGGAKKESFFHLVLIELGGFEPERIEQWKVASEAFDTTFKVRAVGLPDWPEHDDTPKRSPQHIGGGVIQVLGSRGTKSLGGPRQLATILSYV